MEREIHDSSIWISNNNLSLPFYYKAEISQFIFSFNNFRNCGLLAQKSIPKVLIVTKLI